MGFHSGDLALSTRAVHADNELAGSEIAPPISVSSTFRTLPPDAKEREVEYDPFEPTYDVYARETRPTVTRLEKVLGSVIGQPTISYSSGIGAAFAIILHVNPDVVAITDGYSGVHGALRVYKKTRGGKLNIIKLDDPFPTEGKVLCWLETPLNPTGESRSIEHYAKKVHDVGGVLGIDSTFAPPPLQDPFRWGADIVMHSATKYFGGASDALSGTVSVRTKEEWMELWENRMFTGATPGSLESWLVLRSLRTLELRVLRQSASATAIARWLHSLTKADGADPSLSGIVDHVYHTCLQGPNGDGSDWIGEGKQMTSGPACFTFRLTDPVYARYLAHNLDLFVPGASLGGVESLVEQRIEADPKADPNLVRLSIGVEDAEDLKADLAQGFRKVVELAKQKSV